MANDQPLNVVPPPPKSHKMSGLADDDLARIVQAAQYLENPRFLMRAANTLGKPIESLLGAMPAVMQHTVSKAVQKAMETALQTALLTLGDGDAAKGDWQAQEKTSKTRSQLHTATAAATGFAGGFFGAAGLAVELPLTTTVMLRSIAQIARDYGADLNDPAVRLECLAVLALGSAPPKEHAAAASGSASGDVASMESSYYTSRIAIGMALKSASEYVAGRTAAQIAEAVAKRSAPALVRFLSMIVGRFNTVVGEKAIAQAVPVAGALAGAALNAAFTEHFNTVARMHFDLRRLERLHGESVVAKAYGKSLAAQKIR